MAIEDLFDHTCDIYHLVSNQESPGYGLQGSTKYSYPASPDISNQICHVGKESMNLTQGEPQSELEVRAKMGLPIGADIRINDKIVHLQTRLEYRAEVPDVVRNHHISVMIQRKGKKAPI